MNPNKHADPGNLLGKETSWKTCNLQGAALSLASPGALSLLTSGSCSDFVVIAQWGPGQMLMLKSPGLRSHPRLHDGGCGRPLLATGQCSFLIKQMNCWDAQSPLGLSRHLWRVEGMVRVSQEGRPVLRPARLPPPIIPRDTNGCSLLPCSSMHHCPACQGTATLQLRRLGKVKAAMGRMRNSSVWDVQLQIHIVCFELVLGLMQSSPAVAQGVRNAWPPCTSLLVHCSWPEQLGDGLASCPEGICGQFQSELPAPLPTPNLPLLCVRLSCF